MIVIIYSFRLILNMYSELGHLTLQSLTSFEVKQAGDGDPLEFLFLISIIFIRAR